MRNPPRAKPFEPAIAAFLGDGFFHWRVRVALTWGPFERNTRAAGAIHLHQPIGALALRACSISYLGALHEQFFKHSARLSSPLRVWELAAGQHRGRRFYVERRQAFLFDENQQVEWFHPSIAVVDGKEQHLYAIGDSWCWQFADYADDPNVQNWLAGSYLQLHLRPSVRAWIQELAWANGQSVEHHAEFLLACFCEERRDGRPKFDLSGFEATASRAQHATAISDSDAVRVRRGPWLNVVDAVLSLVAAEDGGEPSRLSREMFAETVLDGLARELGGVA